VARVDRKMWPKWSRGDTRLDFHVAVVLDRLGREAWHEPQVCSYSPALSKQ
jgi:hypothetical protein